MDIKIIGIDWHRNGVSGKPFHVVRFDHEGRRMMGVVFDDNDIRYPTIAVFDIDRLNADDIYFFTNSWRGDYYQGALNDAIREWQGNKDKEE